MYGPKLMLVMPGRKNHVNKTQPRRLLLFIRKYFREESEIPTKPKKCIRFKRQLPGLRNLKDLKVADLRRRKICLEFT